MSDYNPSWIDPVYDRTKEDAVYAAYLNNKGDYDYLNDYQAYVGEDAIGEDIAPSNNREITDWDAGLPGAMIRSDMSRIWGDIYIIANILDVKIVYWEDVALIPNTNNYTALRNDLINIRACYPMPFVPAVPNLPYNTYDKMNDVERILYEVYNWVTHRDFAKCGNDTYCGEGGFLI